MTENILKERFKQFSIEVIRFTKELPKSQEFYGIKNQIFRSATSPAANY